MYCCRLQKAKEQERVLAKTDNFFVVPTLGSMGIGGYVLIVPYKHYRAMAEAPQQELQELVSETTQLLRHEYSSPLIFEHGPRVGRESGKLIDHAHLHFVQGLISQKNGRLI